MKNKKFISFIGVGVMALAAMFAFGVSNAQAADSTIQGNLPNTFSDGVNVYLYNAAQDSGCDGIADALEVFYGSKLSGAITLDTTYINTDTDYSITVTEGDIVGANLYAYFCDNSNNVIDIYNVGNFAASQTRNISLGKISNGAGPASDDLDNYRIAICTAVGGTKYNDTTKQMNAATNQYSQYYAFQQAADDGGGSPPTTITAMFDSDSDDCTNDTTKRTGYVIDVPSANDNYGIVIAYNPDTKVTGDMLAGADLNTAVFTVYDDAGTEDVSDDTSAGMGFEINAGAPDGNGLDDDFIIYYDGAKIINDIHVEIATAANGTTHWLSIDEADFTGAGAYDVLVDLNDSGDGVPNDIDDIQTTCNVAGAGAPDDSAIFKTAALHDTYLYDVYMPACSANESVLFKKSGTTVFTKTAVNLTVSATIDVAKISGETHASVQDDTVVDNVEVFTDNVCTVEVSSTDVQPVAAAGDDYEVYFEDTDAAVYMKISEDAGAYASCGNYVLAATFDATQAAALSPSVQVSGIRHADNVAILVDNDKNGALSAADVYTTTFTANVYHIYTVADATSQVVVDNTGDAFGNKVLTTVTEKNFSTDGVVDIAKVTGSEANVNADLLNSGGGATNDLIMTTVASADGTGVDLASVAAVIDAGDNGAGVEVYSSYFEVPNDGLVNFEIQDGDALNAVLAYAYNFATVGGDTYTFEPKYLVAATVPATVLGFEIQQGDSLGYIMRDNTVAVATYTIYVDKTEGALDPHYDYRAYTDAAFTELVLDREEKHIAADTTFGVNTVTNTAIHGDLNGDIDPVDVYTSAAVLTADCATTLRSSDTTQVWGAGSKKYYETNAGAKINLKITDGTNVSCVNTLIGAAAVSLDDAYSINIKTSGNVNADVVTVYIDSDQANGDDISAPVAAGAYAIYWAGDPASNVSFYNITPILLLAINGRSLAIDAAVNVAKVSGNVHADATSIGVHAAADCSGAALNSADVDTDPTYSRYFEGVDGGSYYMKVVDAGTFATCRSALTVDSQAATADFTYKLSGEVPDNTATTLKILSVAIADIANYWSNTIDGGADTTFVAYIAGYPSVGILFKTAVSGGGDPLLQVNKAVAADTVVNVSAANGNAHADIDSVVAVCEAPQTSNATCDTKYSTVAPADAATYEIFFEEQGAPGNYYLEVLDTDTEDYYSWNKFTTAGTAGSYVTVELDGKLSGVTAEAFAPATMVPGVLIGLATDASVFPANEVSRTYSYTDVDPFAAPSGNYRMYANDGTTYDGVGSKSGYITNTTDGVDLVPTAAGLTKNWAMTTGIKVTVKDQGANPITNATVSVYTCTTNNPATCTTAAVTCLNPAGACTRTGNGTAGNGLAGEYNFSGLTPGTYVQFRVSLATFGTVYSPTLDEADNNFVIDDTAQVAGVVMMVAANPGAVSLIINSGAGYTTNPAVTLALNPNATDAAWMAFSCDSNTWSADEAYAASANFNVNTGAGCAVGDGLKTVYVRVRNSSLNASYASDTIGLATAPIVNAQYPLDGGELGVAEYPSVTFSEPMDLGTINTATIQLRDFTTDAVLPYTFVEPDAVTPNKFVLRGWMWTYGQHYYFWVSGVKNVNGVVVADYTTKAAQDFTTLAYTATPPTIESWTPGAGNSIGIDVSPQQNVISVKFDQRIEEGDIDPDNIKLLDSDDNNITLSMLAYGLVSGKTVVIIMPAAPLTYGTDYHITVQNVQDYIHGDTIVAWDSETDGGGLFSTIPVPDGSLGVINIAQVKSWALSDGFWPNGNGAGTGGWIWNMRVTVPVSEAFVRMKFANWAGAAGASIPAAANIRYHSHQAVDATPLTVGAASTYGDSMQINPALDQNLDQDGIQIDVTIESKIPIGSTAGAYSTSYGIESNAANPD